MKPRTPEAERLESDYLARIRAAIGESGNAAEICRSVREHIEEAVAEFKSVEVTLVQMAQVIERLGPPEAYRESTSTSSAPAPRAGDGDASVRLLDKLWLAALIKTVGLYVPVIDFYFCGIIGNVMMAVVLRGERSPELASVRRCNWIVALLMIAAVPVAIGSLQEPLVGLLQLPVGIGLFVFTLMAYWNLIGAAASMVRSAGVADLALSLLGCRRTYVALNIVFFAVSVVIGIVIAVVAGNRREQHFAIMVAGLSLLPVSWILGYFFLLKPLGRARRALAGAAAPLKPAV